MHEKGWWMKQPGGDFHTWTRQVRFVQFNSSARPYSFAGCSTLGVNSLPMPYSTLWSSLPLPPFSLLLIKGIKKERSANQKDGKYECYEVKLSYLSSLVPLALAHSSAHFSSRLLKNRFRKSKTLFFLCQPIWIRCSFLIERVRRES